MDDGELLDAARGGDRAALEAFLERHQRRVLRFGLRMCRDPEDARDVAQDTLLAAARTITAFRGASSPSTWLFSIARSFYIKKRRRSKFAPAEILSLQGEAQAAAAELADRRPGPEERVHEERLADALERAVAQLAPKYREVLVLREFEELTAREVADVTGLSVEAVKSRLHRARRDVRERLAPLLGRLSEARPGCPDILRLFSRHLEGDIDAARCAEMERHLAECGRCEAACRSLRRVLALCRTSAQRELPVQLQQSVRGGIRAFLDRGGGPVR